MENSACWRYNSFPIVEILTGLDRSRNYEDTKDMSYINNTSVHLSTYKDEHTCIDMIVCVHTWIFV